MRINLIFVLLFIGGCISAQTASLKGSVKDSSGSNVIEALISIEGTTLEGLTNGQGNYRIGNIPPGTYSIVVRAMGYGPVIRKVTLVNGEESTNDFRLQVEFLILKEVDIQGVQTNHGMGHLEDVQGEMIYSGKKNEVLIPDSVNGNNAPNNPRLVLGRVPGSNFAETEGGGFPSGGIGFRGLNPGQSVETNVRQNGYNVSADLYGYPESYYLPPMQAVERIEIIRGASSLQYGPQFGGVINYVLKTAPADRKMECTSDQTTGSDGLFNSFNALGGTIRHWNYYTYVQYKSAAGWRQHSGYQQVMGFAKLEFKPSDRMRIALEYSMMRNKIRMPGGLSDEQFRADPSQSFRGRNWLSSPWNISALTATYRASDKTTISLKSALNISARNLVWKNEDGGPQRADSIDPATNQFIQREVQREAFLSSTTELRLLTNYRLAGKSHWLAAGLRYFLGTMSRQGGGPGSTGTDFDLGLYGGSYGYDLRFSTWNVAPFVECLFRIGERLSLTPGLRYEYLHSSAQGYVTDPVNSKDVPVSRVQGRSIPLAGVGIQYKLSEGSQLYGNISQAYRPTDYSNQTPVGVSSKINPNLKDASGYNAEIGWRGTGKDWLVFDAGLFYLSYKNRIGLETLYDVSGNLFTYRTNVADSRHQGAEVYVEISPFKIKEEHSYKINVSVFNSFAWIDARYENGVFHGNSVEFAPKVINRTGITGSYKMYSSSLVMSYTADEFADANNTVRSQDATVGLIPAYTVLDWSFSMKIRKYSFKVGINNLMDRKYFTIRTDEYPGPGIIPSAARNFYLGFATKF